MPKPYTSHLNSASDLKTTYEAVRAGFVDLALEKNRRATPFVDEARALKAAATKAKDPMDLLNIVNIRPALITAAGVSEKAKNHLRDEDKIEAIKGLIKNFLIPAGDNFVEELVFRFLLTRGDTLGGSMRNIGGFIAQCKLSRCIISHLRVSGREVSYLHSEIKSWFTLPVQSAGIENQIKGLYWRSKDRHRTLIFNHTVPIVRNNIDLCLFNQSISSLSSLHKNDANNYIALGELKGGIDPAGADEHWKTARTALTRITDAFGLHGASPKIFFIGAAIEDKMSNEIWQMLSDGNLDNAANLTSDNQMASISEWICNL